mmetsp:Transcript_103061/g.183116  ORF Transcript_103061/g.183116 Transcript_103061/m.183116 type:complete len:427 (-) Transcript_103061:46-1326(-)|eukprot:CAMPEP_0197651340 /NCGR_PEP_ID=MMETSP1338-20131121/31997_1 /TAXON_ID=43686 ORGANISM="Pelagodinium beii, Strain RCC1491" /NCGR_SAMPLE_ID=MMETSP1338 /ASSEMBLY_ACC=CAM_ASM_000754 /LENGTH=426 /DNA_ID=CAMNT_0043225953 /DNA_START=122 /DNA_END=1402 /DNA_ORIENTATION=+
MAEVDKSVQQMQSTGARLVQSSPGLAEKLASSSKAPRTGSGRDDRDTMIAELQRQLDAEKDKNRGLEDQYKHRVASFVKRETATMNKIEALERRLTDGAESDEHSKRMDAIGNMHKSVVTGLECIQNNTAKILQDQEKDLMRAFRARLQEVSKDLEAQRSRKGEHSTELQAHHRRVVAELHKTQELAQTFDKKNQQLTAENQKLQEKLRTREDDRQALLRELVLSRKEVARMKAQTSSKEGAAATDLPSVSEPEKPSRRSFSQKQVDQQRMQQTHNKQFEREMNYREATQKLKRMCEAERRTVQALRQQQAEMMQQRTELEVLLKQSLDDVKAEILRHQMQAEGKDPSSMLPGQTNPTLSAVSVHDLTAQDRERVLELLLSQQRVVQLLYSKTFSSPPAEVPQEAEKGDEFSWLSDVIPGEMGATH